MAPEAKVILDSVSPAGDRLTTLEVKFHRFVLAEFNTHRVFSRNSASSRAIPINKQIAKVLEDPAIPVEWGLNQSGMQANELINDLLELLEAAGEWLLARDDAVAHVRKLQEIGTDSEGNLRGVHKQIANRLLEPFMWHTAIVSSTEWQNFFNQRVSQFSPLAQPEMRAAADLMYDAIKASTPDLMYPNEYHTPYVSADEVPKLAERVSVSIARCARVSYLTHDGIRDVSEDLAMYERLISASPRHESPLEHVATPALKGESSLGNFQGWLQWRHMLVA